MVAIQERVESLTEEGEIRIAPPTAYKSFWPEIRGSYNFRNRRDFLTFMQQNHGRILYLPHRDRPFPPFVLVGDWRSRSDISALWHVRAAEGDREKLVREASEMCLREGAERFVTRPVGEREAEEYAEWGFTPFCRVVFLEKTLRREPDPSEPEGVRVNHFRRKDLTEVLEVDVEAFEDFWRLDTRTLERISESCLRNVFLVARWENRVCGYAVGGTNGRLGYLQRLGVHPLFQGKGVGELLAGRLLRILQVMGASLVSVNTQEDNLPAISLYHKLGFRETGERRFIMQRTSPEAPRGRR